MTDYEVAMKVATSMSDLCLEIIGVGDETWLRRPLARKHTIKRIEVMIRQVREEGVLDVVPDYKPGVLARLVEVRRFLKELSLFEVVPEAFEFPERPGRVWN